LICLCYIDRTKLSNDIIKIFNIINSFECVLFLIEKMSSIIIAKVI
jgi:hypothetical protein